MVIRCIERMYCVRGLVLRKKQLNLKCCARGPLIVFASANMPSHILCKRRESPFGSSNRRHRSRIFFDLNVRGERSWANSFRILRIQCSSLWRSLSYKPSKKPISILAEKLPRGPYPLNTFFSIVLSLISFDFIKATRWSSKTAKAIIAAPRSRCLLISSPNASYFESPNVPHVMGHLYGSKRRTVQRGRDCSSPRVSSKTYAHHSAQATQTSWQAGTQQ